MCELKLEQANDYALIYNHLSVLSFLKDFDSYEERIKEFYKNYYEHCINEFNPSYILNHIEGQSMTMFKHVSIGWYDNGDFDTLFLYLTEEAKQAIIRDKSLSLINGFEPFIDKLSVYDDFINWDIFSEYLNDLTEDDNPDDYEIEEDSLYIMSFIMMDTIRQIFKIDDLIDEFLQSNQLSQSSNGHQYQHL